MSERPLSRMSEHLFCCAGAINVYAVAAGGSECVLIDFGDGGAMDALAADGRRVTDVLITHGHRTQLEGIERLVGAGVRVHVNPQAAVLRPDAMAKCLSPLVPMRCNAVGRFELPRPLPPGLEVCRDLVPGSAVCIGGIEFQVLAAPGHDPEQVVLVTKLDGRRLCFAGDAIHSPGKLYELFSTDVDHYTGAGARQAADTLAAIRTAAPDLVLPSHGPGLREDVADALVVTEGLLRAYAGYKDHLFFGQPRMSDLKEGMARPWGADGPCRLSEHLWAPHGNTYVITSDEDAQACLLVDVCQGTAEHVWRHLRSIGATRPEIILSTQYHYDHLCTAEERARAYPTAEMWAQEAVAYIAENCERIRRPWLLPGRAKCERHLADCETFRWREHTFTAHFMPGQTDGHAGYSAVLDGRKVLFSGDNFYLPHAWGGFGGICGFNGAWDPVSSYGFSARRILDLKPAWILCEHDMAMEFRPEMFEYVAEWCAQMARLQAALSPGGDRARHSNPYMVAFEPFVMPLRFGAAQELRVTLDNRCADRPRVVELAARPPRGISVTPRTLTVHAEADATGEATCRVTVSSGADLGDPLTLVPFEVTIDGVPCGQRSEVFVDLRL